MKKLRGNKKRIKAIENWKKANLKIDFNYLNEYQKDYVKFRLFPWNPVAMSLHNFPNPKGKIRKLIIESFLEIYDEWDKQLKNLNKPYYLKIWLYEPDVCMSQVVCAIGENIDYYNNIFFKPEKSKSFSKTVNWRVSEKLKKYDWEYHIEEYSFLEDEITIDNFYDEIEFKKFNKALEKDHRVTYPEIEGEKVKMILIPGSDVWVGEIKASR